MTFTQKELQELRFRFVNSVCSISPWHLPSSKAQKFKKKKPPTKTKKYITLLRTITGEQLLACCFYPTLLSSVWFQAVCGLFWCCAPFLLSYQLQGGGFWGQPLSLSLEMAATSLQQFPAVFGISLSAERPVLQPEGCQTSAYSAAGLPFDLWALCGEMRKKFLLRQVSSVSFSSLLALGVLWCVGDQISLHPSCKMAKRLFFKCNRSTVATLQC